MEVTAKADAKKRLSNISTTSEDSGVVGQEVIGLEPAPGPPPVSPASHHTLRQGQDFGFSVAIHNFSSGAFADNKRLP